MTETHMTDQSSPYFLGYRRAEQERLERQADQLAHESDALFERIGVSEGWRVVEIGCGPRGCLELLSARVGKTGQVIGVERNLEQVERARQFVTEQRLDNVTVQHGDGRATGLEGGVFDLATARLVLVNVPQPQEIVREMARLVREGGVVALHEADSTTQRTDPPSAAQTRLLELLNAYAEHNGIDRAIAPKLPRLLRAHGITDIQLQPFAHIYPPGHPRRMLLPEFVANARQGLLDEKWIDAGELDALTAALVAHLESAETLVMSSVFVQAWGRKGAQG